MWRGEDLGFKLSVMSQTVSKSNALYVVLAH